MNKFRWNGWASRLVVGLLSSAGCGPVTDDIDLEDIDEMPSELEPTANIRVSDESSGLNTELGMGYDSITGRTLSARCVYVTGTKASGMIRANLDAKGSENRDEVLRMLDLGGQFGVGHGPVSAGIKADFKRELEEKRGAITFVKGFNAQLPSESIASVKVTEAGRAALADKSWRRTCGDELVVQRNRGVLFAVIIRLDFETTATKRDFESGISVEAPGAFGRVGAHLSRTDRRALSQMKVHVAAYQFGGDAQNLVQIMGSVANERTIARPAVMMDCGPDNLGACHEFIERALHYAGSDGAGLSKIKYGQEVDLAATLSFTSASYRSLGAPSLSEEAIESRMDRFVSGAKQNGIIPADATGQNPLLLPKLGAVGRRVPTDDAPTYQHYESGGEVVGTVFGVPGYQVFYLPVGPLQRKYMDLIEHPNSMRLGYPIFGVQKTKTNLGEERHTLTFENGAIYAFSNSDTAFALHGAIYRKYHQSGEMAGPMGYPTSDVRPFSRKGTEELGDSCEFTNGLAYRWRDQETVEWMCGPVYKHWKNSVSEEKTNSGDTKPLGLPLGTVYTTVLANGKMSTTAWLAEFENGALYGKKGGRHINQIQGSFYDAWRATGGRDGYLGLPLEGNITAESVNSVRFEHGTLIQSANEPVKFRLESEDEENDLKSSFRVLAAGKNHYCGLKGNSSLQCLGDVARDGAPTSAKGPYFQVSTYKNATCALRADRDIECFVDGRFASEDVMQIKGPFEEVAVNKENVCAITRRGDVDCWDLKTAASSLRPPPGPYAHLSAAATFMWGLKADGNIEAWGKGILAPPQAEAGIEFVNIAAGESQGCAVTSRGNVQCTRARGPWSGRNGYTQVAVTNWTVLALKSNGEVDIWGMRGFASLQTRKGPYRQIVAGPYGYCMLSRTGAAECY